MRVLISIAVLLGAIFYGTSTFLQNQEPIHFIFDTDKLHTLSRQCVAASGNDTKAMVATIVDQLRQDDKIAPYLSVDEEWIFNNAGGAMGAMYLIHASITEYLIIFGTPLGTEGHTGRHTATDYFHILSGTQKAFSAGSFTPEIYPPGSVHVLPRGEVKQYKMDDGCFALEYARGFIPGMLLFGYGDGLTSTFDLPTLWRTTWVTGWEMVGNLMKGKI